MQIKTIGGGDHMVPLGELVPRLAAFPQLRSLSLSGFGIDSGASQLRAALPLLSELRLRRGEFLRGAEALAAVVENLEVRKCAYTRSCRFLEVLGFYRGSHRPPGRPSQCLALHVRGMQHQNRSMMASTDCVTDQIISFQLPTETVAVLATRSW